MRLIYASNRPQSAEKDKHAESATRSATDDNMDMDVDDQYRASGSRRAYSSGAESEEEPLSSQHRTKGTC